MKAFFRRMVAVMFERQVRRLIARRRLRVVAVAGSVGKTGTKLAIATVLSQRYRVMVHEGNYNSEIGLPLSVFKLDAPRVLFNPVPWLVRLLRTELAIRGRYPYDVLVLELGTDRPGEIARYLRYLRPDVGVITAVSPEHMENFPGGLDQVAAEELLVAAGSRHVLAGRDEIAVKYRKHFIDSQAHHSYYGLSKEVDYGFALTATDPRHGTTGALSKAGTVVLDNIKLHVFGTAGTKAALAAYATGDLLGLTPDELNKGLEEIRPIRGRMQPLKGQNDSIIIDDTYNSSPAAVSAALQALADAPVAGRRIAVLGSMNELGPESPRYHEQAGAAAAGVDWLITVGHNANKYTGTGAAKAGLDPSRIKPADSPYAAGEFVKLMLQPGDVVLVKGSQDGIFAEEAAKLLLADPVDARKLVRQSPEWMTTKRRQFSDAPQP